MSITTLSIVALGFVLGMRHATDADHVVAVTTIVSGQRSLRPAALVGALWGIGHTLTIFIVGSGIILFNWVIPVRLGLAMELAVGAMLILLGALKLGACLSNPNTLLVGRLRRQKTLTISNVRARSAPTRSPSRHYSDGLLAGVHVNHHGDSPASHPHAHGAAPDSRSSRVSPLARLDHRFHGLSGYLWLRPIVVGIVHGLAGSAAVALLVLSTIRDPRWAVTYLLVFGVGTIAGMMLLTTAVAIPFVYSNRPLTNRRLQMGTGLISVCFGLLMAYSLLVAAP